jgi:protein translocase SecG subunit
MKGVLPIIQIVIAIALIIAVLLQGKGAGLSDVFGGSGGAIHQTKRGMDKFLHIATIVLGTIFLGIAVLSLILA